MPFHPYIQNALAKYDQKKGVRRKIMGDHPAIAAIRKLPPEKQDDISEILNCFFNDNPNIQNETDDYKKQHASFIVFQAAKKILYLQLCKDFANYDGDHVYFPDEILGKMPVNKANIIYGKLKNTELMGNSNVLGLISKLRSDDAVEVIDILASSGLLTIGNLEKFVYCFVGSYFTEKSIELEEDQKKTLAEALTTLKRSGFLTQQKNFHAFFGMDRCDDSEEETQRDKWVAKIAERTNHLTKLIDSRLCDQKNFNTIVMGYSISSLVESMRQAELFVNMLQAGLLNQKNLDALLSSYIMSDDRFVALFKMLARAEPSILNQVTSDKIMLLASKKNIGYELYLLPVLSSASFLTQESFMDVFNLHPIAFFSKFILPPNKCFEKSVTGFCELEQMIDFFPLCKEVILKLASRDPICFKNITISRFADYRTLCYEITKPSSENEAYFDVIQNAKSYHEAFDAVKQLKREEGYTVKVNLLTRHGFLRGKNPHGLTDVPDLVNKIKDDHFSSEKINVAM